MHCQDLCKIKQTDNRTQENTDTNSYNQWCLTGRHNLGWCVCVRVLCRGESSDKVMALRGSCSGSSVGLAVQLALHEEVALLFKVDVTVGAHEAARVTELVPRFHHCAPIGEQQS